LYATVKQRKALTQARRPARVDTWGDPAAGRALARAIDVAGVGEDALTRYTHGFHTYPARLHPITARRALEAMRLPRGALVVDPFCGSGTVLVEGMLAGARTVGVDANPLARLVARAKTRLLSPAERRDLVTAGRRLAALVVAEGKAARRAGYEPPPPRPLPEGIDPEEREERLRGWFDPHVRRELEALASGIAAERDAELRELLSALLSSVLVKMSRRSSDTAGEKVTRRLARGMAARLVAERAELLAKGLAALADDVPEGTRAAEVRAGDARELGKAGLADATVAAVVTSPPYAGTYDYLAHHELRMWFLGLRPDELAEKEIGARRHFRGPAAAVEGGLLRWQRGMGQVLRELARVLVPGGRAALVMGDSLLGEGNASRALWVDDAMGELVPKSGLVLVAAASQARATVSRWEEKGFAARPKREHVILVERPRE
jgi:SAM-dependent methyltransferase